jgi:hypothetical protein
MGPLTESQRADVRLCVTMATVLWGAAVAACVAAEHRLTPWTMVHLGIGVVAGIVLFFICRPSGRAFPFTLVFPTILVAPTMLRAAHVHNGEYWFLGLYLTVVIVGVLYRRRSVKSTGSQAG